tara:strand:- start:1198 stop:1572 length:375 start_codon:yes stop_codon:yes gene_type:complete
LQLQLGQVVLQVVKDRIQFLIQAVWKIQQNLHQQVVEQLMILTLQHVLRVMVDQVVVDQSEKQLLEDQVILPQQLHLKEIMVEQLYQETLCHVQEQVVVEVEQLLLEQQEVLLVVELVEQEHLT